ncbi:MAG: CHAD domain-containing protein [Pirellulales bacterium]|nr:CHAD domain-containing protein [Pirellulales bacterium]
MLKKSVGGDSVADRGRSSSETTPTLHMAAWPPPLTTNCYCGLLFVVAGSTLGVMAGKWIPIESPDLPAATFAADVLRMRMQYVERMLPLAAHEYRQDVEHVHQLRVGCRRADAAVRAFRPLMQGKPKKLRKWLRCLRQAAGPARDADVLLLRLREEAKQTPDKAQRDYVLERLKRYRNHAQQALVDVEISAQSGKLQGSLEKCLALLQQAQVKPEYRTVGQFAQSALRDASRGMFELAGLHQPTVAQLHQLRIAGKRLRYSIELFFGAFPPALRQEVYPLVEKIQSRLGSMNDHATAQALFQHWLANLPTDERAAYLARRIADEHQASLSVRDDFLKWWTQKRAAKLEAHLAELIDGGN